MNRDESPLGGSDRRARLTICGTGNAAHALAVVASQNFLGDIDWLAGSPEKVRTLRVAASGGLRSVGAFEGRASQVRKVSSDPADVIPGADMVLLAVPAFGHATVLERILPHLESHTIIGCLPTRGGFEFEAELAKPVTAARRVVFGLQTLPWSTRVAVPGEVVTIGAVKARVCLASLPAGVGGDLADELSRMLSTRVVHTEHFLNLTLGNPGQWIHSGLMYAHFHSWRGEEYPEERIPRLYADASDDMGEVVRRLSDEARTVARALESQSGGSLSLSEVLSIHDWLRSTYAHVTRDTSTVGSCFRTGPIQMRKAPMREVRPGWFVPDFDYRYLSEDVPYGLVVTRAVADLAGVSTPMMDEVITWAESVTGKVYLADRKVAGPDASTLPIPQRLGITNAQDLLNWYSLDPVASPRTTASSRPR